MITSTIRSIGANWGKSVLMLSALLLAWLPGMQGIATEPGDGSQDLDSQFEQLRDRMLDLERENEALRGDLDQLEGRLEDQAGRESPSWSGLGNDRLRLSGEGAVILVDTGSNGAFPNSEFRVDEARMFLDVKVLDTVFAFTELFLAQRESSDLEAYLGEMYIDVEDLWRSRPGLLNLRAGRMDIPYGEEYLVRDAIDDPLISHSLPDFWGIDEGIELYGRHQGLDYVVAVQNGSHDGGRDFDSDKAVAARIGYNHGEHLRVSLSAMRTGDLNAEEDQLSELWFGNGFIRSVGNPETATTFDAELLEGDVQLRWDSGHVFLVGGIVQYDDDDSAADNERDATYYWVEAVQDIRGGWYGGARFSQINADDGFPIAGQAPISTFFGGPLVEDVWRLSLGTGYRWGRSLVLKAEYSIEQGNDIDGNDLDDRDMVAVQAAFGFF